LWTLIAVLGVNFSRADCLVSWWFTGALIAPNHTETVVVLPVLVCVAFYTLFGRCVARTLFLFGLVAMLCSVCREDRVFCLVLLTSIVHAVTELLVRLCEAANAAIFGRFCRAIKIFRLSAVRRFVAFYWFLFSLNEHNDDLG